MGTSSFDQLKPGEDMLQMEHITKIYDNGFVANNDANFTVRKGEIHGLVGENGAGKTTLMKVLFGQLTPEQGQILIAGKPTKIKNPLDALGYGIGMVHQHFMLVDHLSVLDNMVLGSEPTKGLLYDRKTAYKEIERVSKEFDLPVDPNAIVGDLSVGMKQRVEMLKILLKGAKLLLLDEPTAVLTPQETKELFIKLKELRDRGFSIVFISHKLNEVKEICDRITVLRAGRTIATLNVDEVSEQDISRLMVGHNVEAAQNTHNSQPGKTVLQVRDLSRINANGKYDFEHINFDVREGEILGIAGVEGNGQSELSDTIGGIFPIQSGDILMEGKSLRRAKSNRDLRNAGISLIHEDRMTYGVSTNQPIWENIMADRYYKKEYTNGINLNIAKQKADATKFAEEFTVKTDSVDEPVRTLSGGNIQKVVAAREFTNHPKFLLACQPTRGIDIGAAEMIRQKMLELRDKQRTAILLVSADLYELLTVSDSIMVFYEGHIVAYFPNASDANEEILGEYMLGLKKMPEEELRGLVHENN